MLNYYRHVFILFSAFFEGHSRFAWKLFLYLFKPLPCTRRFERKGLHVNNTSALPSLKERASTCPFIQPLASLETKAHISWSSCLNEFAHNALRWHMGEERVVFTWEIKGKSTSSSGLQSKKTKIPNGISKHAGFIRTGKRSMNLSFVLINIS